MVLELTKQRLNSAESRVDKFIDSNIYDWAETEMLVPIRNELLAAGISQNGANSVALQKVGFMKVNIVWDYRNEKDKPLHFYIEYDTRPHAIEALGKIHGGADYLKFPGAGGKNIFRKRVMHPGTHGKMILHSLTDKYKPALRARVVQETNNYLRISAL